VTVRRLLVAVALAAVAAMPVAMAQAQRSPSRLFVAADEWSLVLSRASIAPGKALIQFQNRGEDPHDLRIRRMGGAGSLRVMGIGETEPSALQGLEVRLSPGRYRLWCSLPGHRAKGMRAILRVRRAR
jgi:hypothetical protein